MEEEVLAQKIKNTYIIQPSLIAGERDEKRPMENMAKYIMKILNPLLLGPVKKYRSIHPEKIAIAMVYLADKGYEKTRIKSDKINRIANKAIEKGIS